MVLVTVVRLLDVEPSWELFEFNSFQAFAKDICQHILTDFMLAVIVPKGLERVKFKPFPEVATCLELIICGLVNGCIAISII